MDGDAGHRGLDMTTDRPEDREQGARAGARWRAKDRQADRLVLARGSHSAAVTGEPREKPRRRLAMATQ